VGELRHANRVNSARFSPDGRRVVTASEDCTAGVWDAQTGLALGSQLRHEGMVISARFSPDGWWVVTASGDHTARLWEVTTSERREIPVLGELRRR
jgi:WD40 repeat protein